MTDPNDLEVARNMVQSPDNWPPMLVKRIAEIAVAALERASVPQEREKALREAAAVCDTYITRKQSRANFIQRDILAPFPPHRGSDVRSLREPVKIQFYQF